MDPTIGSMLLGMKFAEVPNLSYSTADLEADLAAGVSKIVAGIGGDYRLTVDTATGYITAAHKDAVYGGSATPGAVYPALALTAAGLAMGYNRASDGAWVNAVAIDASGNASFSGAVNATSGNFTGTITVGSVIANSVTVDGVSLGTIRAGAAYGATAVQPAAILGMLTSSSTYILGGTVSVTEAGKGIRTGNIAWDSNGTVNAGSGVAITAKGIVGAVNGVPTFSINGTTGAAIFKGDITGAVGSFSGAVSTTQYIYAKGDTTGYGSSRGAIIGESLSTGYSAIYGISNGSFKFSVIGENLSSSSGGVMGIGRTGTYGITTTSGGFGVYGDSNGALGTAGVYSSGKFGTNNSSLVANLNAQYLNGKQLSDMMVWTGASPVAGAITANYSVSINVGGITVRVPIAYP